MLTPVALWSEWTQACSNRRLPLRIAAPDRRNLVQTEDGAGDLTYFQVLSRGRR